MTFNVHWPKTPGNNYVPWYLILWCALFVFPAWCWQGLTCGLISCAYGAKSGKRLWDEF